MLREFTEETLSKEFYTPQFEANQLFHRAQKVTVQNKRLIQHHIKI